MKFKSEVQLEALNNATVDTDKFLVSDSSTVKYRTGSQLLSDLGVSGIYVPYTGATGNVDLGTHTLLARDLVINHSSGSGVAASITKGGSGEALTINKTSGSGNAMSVTGGLTSLVDLTLFSIPNATIDTDRFIVSDSGAIKYRTGAQVLSDIGGQSALTNPITGTGTTNYVSKFTGTTTLGNSLIYDNGTNVGIGTTSPAAKLDVNGTFNSTALWTTSGNVTQWGYAGTAYGILTWDTGYARIHATSGNRLDLGAGGGLHMTIATSGNVGIGTTSPGAVLQVGEATGITGALSAKAKIVVDAANTTDINNVLNLISKYNGSPSAAAGSGPALLFSGGIGDAQTRTYAKIVGKYSAYNMGGLAFHTQDTADIITEKMTILPSSGNVGIGTTSPGAKLQVGDGSFDANARVFHSDSTYTEMRGYGIISNRTTAYIRPAGDKTQVLAIGNDGNTWNYISHNANYHTFGTDLAERMRIDLGGNVGIGTTSPDVRLEVVEASPTNGIVADFVNSTNAGGTIAAIKLSNSDTDVCDVVLGANRVGANYGSDFFISPSDGVDGTNQERFRITEAGAVKFNAYNSTNNTGTPTYLLGTDASGNVVKTLSSAAPGSLWLASGNDIYNSNSANVGIGTTSPSDYSADANNLVVGSHTGNNGISILSASTGGFGSLYFADGTATTASKAGYIRYEQNASNMTFGINAVEKMRIDLSGNVGIGTTSPTQAKLVVNATSLVASAFGRDGTDGDVVQIYNGLAGTTKAIALGVSGNDGTIYSQYGDLLLQPTAGNVGIGTTSPGAKLEVAGGRIAVDSNYGFQLALTSATQIGRWFNSSGTNYLQGDGGRNWQIGSSTNGVNTHFDNANNRVGIGTTSPAAKLQVEKSSEGSIPALGANTSFLKISNTSGNYGSMIGQLGSGNAYFQVQRFDGSATAYNLLLQPNGGNVGIGTTTPGAKLDVNGDVFINSNYTGSNAAANDLTIGKTTTGNHGITIATGPTYTGSIYFGDSGNNDAGIIEYQHSDNSMKFTTNRSEKMRITSAGNVGIGTTAPTEKLDVVGKIALNDGGNSVFIGTGAGLNDDGTDNRNVGVGFQALYSNTTGSSNVANGYRALFYNTTGNYNTANGYAALHYNTTGNYNTANGYAALFYNTTGSSNVANGLHSGRYIADKTTAATILNNSIMLGYRASPLADNQTNQIVIGYDATGIGSNTVVLGNDSIVTTQLKGNVGIGTTTPSQKLHVSGNARITGAYYDSNNSSGTSGQVLSSTVLGTDWITIPSSSLWTADTNGITYASNVGIGQASVASTSLGVTGFAHFSGEARFDSQARFTNEIRSSNGVGTAGQALVSNGTGNSVSWGWIRNTLTSNFQHASNSSLAYYFMPFSGDIEITTNQWYNNFTAAYAGRIRKIILKNTNGGTTPTATKTIFRVTKNGTTLYTSAEQGTTAGYNMYAAATLGDSDATFAEGDRLQVSFNADGTWQNAAASIIIEYTEN